MNAVRQGRRIGVLIRSVGGAERTARPPRPPARSALADPQAADRRQRTLVGDATERLLLGLRVGDSNDEILGAWLAKEFVRDALDADNAAEAGGLLDKTITSCQRDTDAEIRALGKTLQR